MMYELQVVQSQHYQSDEAAGKYQPDCILGDGLRPNDPVQSGDAIDDAEQCGEGECKEKQVLDAPDHGATAAPQQCDQSGCDKGGTQIEEKPGDIAVEEARKRAGEQVAFRNLRSCDAWYEDGHRPEHDVQVRIERAMPHI